MMMKDRSFYKKMRYVFFFTIFIGVFISIDFHASNYGKGILYNKFKKLKYKPQVEFYQANFNITTERDFPLVHSDYYFPTTYNSERIYIDSIYGIGVKDNSLFVSILDSLGEDKVLKINQVSNEGFATSFSILERRDVANIDEIEVVFNQKYRMTMILIHWPFVLCLSTIVIAVICFLFFTKRT